MTDWVARARFTKDLFCDKRNGKRLSGLRVAMKKKWGTLQMGLRGPATRRSGEPRISGVPLDVVTFNLIGVAGRASRGGATLGQDKVLDLA